MIPRCSWVHLLLLWLLTPIHSSPAQHAMNPDGPRFIHLGVADGLSQSSVYCILQDRTGFIWFGTADGLNRYDGYQFTQFRARSTDTTSLSHSTIRSLFEDKAGVLWVGTERGLNRYDGRTDTFTRFVQPKGDGRTQRPTAIHAMFEDHRGRFWIGSPTGLYLLDREHGEFDTIPPWKYGYDSSTSVYAIDEDDDHRLWVGTGRGLRLLGEQSGDFVSLPLPGSLRGLEYSTISRIFRDSNGHIWVCAGGNEVTRIEQPGDRVQRFTVPAGHPVAITEDESGFIWAGTETGWLIIPGKAGSSIAPGGELSGRSFAIGGVYRDRSGIIWIGTDGNGIFKIDRQRKAFRHIRHIPGDRNSLAADFVRAVLEDAGGNLWVGTQDGGLSSLDIRAGTWTHFVHQQGNNASLPHNTVHALCRQRDDEIWVGTEAGLARLDLHSKKFTRFLIRSSNRPANIIRCITPIGPDTLAVGTMLRPLFFLRSSRTFVPIVAPNGDTLRGSTWTLYPDRSGGLWWGTYGPGVGYLNLRSKTWRWFAPKPGMLTNGSVRAIYEDSSGSMWFGTEDGLVRFDPKTDGWRTFTVDDGLPNNFVYAILPDNRGCLWISTNKGLSRFNLATGTFRNYDPADGLQSNEYNTGAYFRSPRGELFFGGINGLNAFFPDSIKDNPHVPPVVLTKFKLFDAPAHIGITPWELHQLELQYDQNIFSFEFDALEYTNPARNSYMYTLRGFEDGWTSTGTQHEVRYTHLPPGHYTFVVKAANNDGVWNEAGVTVEITIVPPFWRTWWFYTAMGLVLLGSVGGTIRFVEMRRLNKRIARLEEARALDRERERISQDMHDDVGANLTKIAIMSELALKSTRDPEATRQLEGISGTARDVVDNIGQIIWALNPRNNKLENLTGYIREHAFEFFEGTPIRCICNFPDESPDVALSAEIRRNVFLVVKEALHNVAKHSGAGTVRLDLSLADGFLRIGIQDDGSGFDVSGASTVGNGILNMKKRVEEINGSFVIESGAGKGTRVELGFRTQKPG